MLQCIMGESDFHQNKWTSSKVPVAILVRGYAPRVFAGCFFYLDHKITHEVRKPLALKIPW